MPDTFDPYYTWLGIPPSEQPADHYRLLGIQRFEENREVISHAADQRMAHVRSFQTGPAARDSQRVLNELSKAAGCLLNPRRKAMYDQHLRSSSAQAATAEALLPPQGSPGPAVQIKTHSKPRPLARRASHRVRTQAGIAVAVFAAVALAVLTFYRPEDEPEAVAQPNAISPAVPATTAEATGSSSAAETPAAASSPAALPAGSPVNSAVAVTPAATPTSPTAPSVAPIQPENPLATSLPAASESAPQPAGTKPPVTSAVVASPASISAQPEAMASSADIPSGKPKALHFDGSAFVELADSRGLLDFKTPFTVELWVRFAPEAGLHWLAGDMIIGPNHPAVPAGTVAGWQLFIQPGLPGSHRVGFSTREGFASDFAAVKDAWHHLAASSDGRRLSIHIDGRRAAAGDMSKLQGSFSPSPLPVHIGGHGYLHANQSSSFQGDLRAVRVSSVCRYTANFTPAAEFSSDPDTLVLLDFLKASGNRIPDASGNDHAGIIHGASWIPLEPAAAPLVAATGPAMPGATVPGAGSPTPPSRSPATAAATEAVVKTEERLPAPAAEALTAARDRFRKVFEAELKQARTPEDQLALANKLMGLAADSGDDQAGRFVMIEESAKLAAGAGDLDKSLSLLDDLARRYQIASSLMKAAAVTKCAESAKTASDRRKLATTCLTLLEEIIPSGDFEAAGEVVHVAVTSAARAKDIELGKIARDYRDDIAQSKKRFAELSDLEEQLKANPKDQSLQLRWGRFVCFCRRDWETGLTHLSQGSDEGLATIAKRELENPDQPEEQVSLGQRWMELSKQLDNAERPAAALRALYWFRRAESQLKGLAKADVEHRIQDLQEKLPPRFRHATGKPVESKVAAFQPPPEFIGIPGRVKVSGLDVGILWNYQSGLRLNHADVARIVAQANVPRGKLQLEFAGFVMAPESMTVNVTQQGGSPTATATLFVDNKAVGEVGGMRATSDVYKLELNAGEHTVRWVIQGDELGTSKLEFTNSATAQPLVLYHTQALLNLVRESPTRARLNVNMNRN